MQEYLLEPHVYPSVTEGGAVLLDRRRGRYFGLSLPNFERLRIVVHGDDPIVPCTEEDRHAAIRSADKLLAQGLLTRDQSRGKPISVVVIASPDSLLVDPDELPVIDTSLYRERFHFAVTTTNDALAQSFDFALTRIESRKARHPKQITAADLPQLRILVAAFMRLRPTAYTAHKYCLPDALTMLEFLAGYDLYPLFVIGTCTEPFAAHAWAQLEDGHVLTGGEPFDLKKYTPALAI